MNRIRVLPKEISEKIAAGEVIESPLSVVKELVENSIDAESDQIIIEIKNGGKDYIRVTDNGSGIEKDDLSLAILSHATSKIRFAEDLFNISSLGFRGEALFSIAAVSKLEIISKTEEAKSGRRISVSALEVTEESDAAADKGTTVVIKDLFFNLPARQKFLRSSNKESSAISEFISRMALAYPGIRFRFISDGVIRFSTPGKGDVYQTILTVYSPQNARKLIKMNSDNGFMTVKGYISSPLESRKDRKQQVFFVNGRLVSSNIMEKAVKDAYSDKLFEGHFPSVYIFLELDPSKVDVNIHPRKSEVKFLDETEVYDFLYFSIRDALLDKNATEIKSEDIKTKQISTYSDTVDKKESPEVPSAAVSTVLNQDLISKVDVIGNDIKEVSNIFKQLRTESEKTEVKPEQVVSEFLDYDTERFLFSTLKPISQIFGTYILASDDDNFYIFDQHAAHERVMYEKLMKNFNEREKAGQILLAPLIIELDRSQSLLADDCLPLLNDMSFSLELFGETSYLVKEIPYFMEMDEAERFIYEFFSGAEDVKNNIILKKDHIISRACKSAIKAHDKLSIEEMISLFKELDGCENPYSCPHGRPTFIKFNEYELEKMFKRKA